jgi:hypothetical protein
MASEQHILTMTSAGFRKKEALGYSICEAPPTPNSPPSRLGGDGKVFNQFVAFFSVTIDGRNLIFGHKLHIGMPCCG